jgi:hypothetical protein
MKLQARVAMIASFFLLAGCGGPELHVKTSPPDIPAKVYFRPVRDGAGNEFPTSQPETYIGEAPTDWDIPEEYLGGWGYVRLDFGGGKMNDAQFQISKKVDTEIRVAAPAVSTVK